MKQTIVAKPPMKDLYLDIYMYLVKSRVKWGCRMTMWMHKIRDFSDKSGVKANGKWAKINWHKNIIQKIYLPQKEKRTTDE